jgi:hypothetical protein
MFINNLVVDMNVRLTINKVLNFMKKKGNPTLNENNCVWENTK